MTYKLANFSHESKCDPLTPSISPSSDPGIAMFYSAPATPGLTITLDAINSGSRVVEKTVTLTATNPSGVTASVQIKFIVFSCSVPNSSLSGAQ